MHERPGGSTVSKNDLQTGEQLHMLRNSSSIHEGDNKCSEYVYLRKNSDGFLGDVADTFSPDVAGFEFCNTPGNCSDAASPFNEARLGGSGS